MKFSPKASLLGLGIIQLEVASSLLKLLKAVFITRRKKKIDMARLPSLDLLEVL